MFFSPVSLWRPLSLIWHLKEALLGVLDVLKGQHRQQIVGPKKYKNFPGAVS